MDPISITLIVVSAVSGFTAVVSFIGTKIHNKHKENKKIITKITEGDIIKKHDHSNKNKTKHKDKKEDKDTDLNKLKLEGVKVTNNKSEDLNKGDLNKNSDLKGSVSSEKSSSSLESDGCITEIKFKQVYIEQNLSSLKEGTTQTFGGKFELIPNQNSNMLKALAPNGLELLGKDIIEHHG